MATDMKIALTCEPLLKSSFVPYGDVIEIDGAKQFSINGGAIERYHDLADVDIGAEQEGKPIISIGQCNQLTRFPYSINMLERHPKGSQAFIPMNDTPVIIAVAPFGDKVNPEEIQAFITNGKQGFNFKKGLWHMPLVSTEQKQQFLIVDRSGPGNNCEESYWEGCFVEISI